MQDESRNQLPDMPQTVPPGTMSYELRQELGLAEGPLTFTGRECAIVEYLPSVEHDHQFGATVSAITADDIGRPGYFRDYTAAIGPERPYVTLRSRPDAWSKYALRRIAEETGVTVLSNAEADAYLIAWNLREAERDSWPRWMKIIHVICERLLDRFHREPKFGPRQSVLQILFNPDISV